MDAKEIKINKKGKITFGKVKKGCKDVKGERGGTNKDVY